MNKKIGVMIRKWDYTENNQPRNPSRKHLNKQILTLHKKLKKADTVITEYSIEKDKDADKYHTHLLIHYNDKENLHNQLSRFIGGNGWVIREMGLNAFNECNGKYGLVHTQEIIDEYKYRAYIDKKEQIKTLI